MTVSDFDFGRAKGQGCHTSPVTVALVLRADRESPCFCSDLN